MVKGVTGSDLLDQLKILSQLGSVGDLSDGQLLRQFVSARDEAARAAFSVLVERHGPMVLRVCRQVLGDGPDSDDAFQATFLVLARKAGSVRKAESVASWLHGVARRVAVRARMDAIRRDFHQRRAAERKAAESGPERDEPKSWPELHEEVTRLPHRYREAVVLCYLEGLTTEVAAKRMGCSQGTVLSRLSRARDRLRTQLARRSVELPSVLPLVSLASQAAIPHGLRTSAIRAAFGLSGRGSRMLGTVPGTIATLADLEMRGMMMTNLRIVLAPMLAVGIGSVGGLGFAYTRAGQEPQIPPAAKEVPRKDAKAAPAQDETKARAEANRSLRTIALAMHNYHSKENRLPGPSIRSADGKPLLSWRVAILPDLGQQELFDEFRKDEPWDSPHNKALLAKMPKVYEPGSNIPNATRFKVLAGPDALFEEGVVMTFDLVADGTSFTIMAVQGGEPVPWTKPEDIPFAGFDKPLPKITGPLKGGFLAVMADGSVHFVSEKAQASTVERAILKNDGQEYKCEDLDPK